MKIYKYGYLLYESTKEHRFNDILKNLGVMDSKGSINLNDMTKKIDNFLSKEENKKKFLKEVDKDVRPHVDVKKVKIKSRKLRPSQDQIFLDHIISRLVVNDYEREQILSGDLKERDILVSSDNYIIDGHHRWAASMVLNPSCDIECTQVNLPIEYAIPMIDSILDAERGENVSFSGNYKYNIYDVVKQKSKEEIIKMIDDIVSKSIKTGVEVGKEDKLKSKLNEKFTDKYDLDKDNTNLFYKEIKKKLKLNKHPLKYLYKNTKKLPRPDKIDLHRDEMPHIKHSDAEKYL
jgi:hypothetical protein